METEKTIKGYFYLPDSQDKEIAGILYFKPGNKIFLELIGGLSIGDNFEDFFSSKSESIILGISSDAQKITLINCTISSSLNTSSKFPLTNYNCKYFVLGSHVLGLDDNKFDYLISSISDLYYWRPRNTIKLSTKSSTNNEIEEANLSVSYNKNSEDEFPIGKDFYLKFISSSGLKTEFLGKKYTLTEETLLKIANKKEKVSISALLNKLELFHQFLSMAKLSEVKYLEINLFNLDNYQEISNDRKIYHPSALFFVDRRFPDYSSDKNFLFRHSDINDDFQEIIKKWYEITEAIAPIREHLIESIRLKRTFKSIDFLIIVQALEGYHSRFIAKKPDDQIYLGLRIEDIFHRFSNIEVIKALDINVNQIVASRNYYSHLGKKKVNVLDGYKLYLLTIQIRQLLICCVLESVGFRHELINNIMNNQER